MDSTAEPGAAPAPVPPAPAAPAAQPVAPGPAPPAAQPAQPVSAQPAAPVAPGPAPEAGLDRIWTIPNAITLVRLACIPLFLWLLFGTDRQTGAAVLLAGLGATDWVDGYVARRYRQVSTLGKVLDPVADRILVVTAVIAIIVHGAVPVWFGAATLAREVVVSGAVLLLASLGAARIDVLWVGKAGTFALMFAYPAFLLGYGNATWQEPVRVIAWITGLIGLTLAWIAAASYVPVARRALADGRRARTHGATAQPHPQPDDRSNVDPQPHPQPDDRSNDQPDAQAATGS